VKGETIAAGVKLVTAEERQARLGQVPATLLFTGLSGSGKTTIARGVERALFDAGRTAIVLDGEDMRRGLSRDLEYTADDRSENLRRASQLARMLNENGFICLAALIAPDAAMRDKAAELIGRERYLTIHVDAPLELCQSRDPRGHYRQAQEGHLPALPGAGSTYEVPQQPDLVINTSQSSIEECTEQVIELLKQRKLIR
ncbi:MAG: adenylyl-sulfate kinase, partial [Aureliella sp.]